ncbi:replicative DNA helicase [Streptomyces sp. NPDC090093]|uniref:replicative DNA helicase n=1 Tax=Streptomyces sp. NPDC090093 TaxID=3365945 RepID=UPI0038178A5F
MSELDFELDAVGMGGVPEPVMPVMAVSSPEAEDAVLGACLLATPAYDPVAEADRILAPGDLRPLNQPVWDAIVRLHGAGLPTGVPAVESELRRSGDLERIGGVLRLSQIAQGACSGAEAGHYAGIVHGYAQLRRYQEALVRGMQTARQADPFAVPEAIAAHQAELEALATDAAGEDPGLYGRFGEHLDAELDALADPREAAAVTGLADLDNLLHMAPGELVLVAGRPAMGKSALTLGIAVANARSGRPVLFHSLEMGRAEVTQRVMSARARVPFHHLRGGSDTMTESDWDRLDRHVPEMRSLPLWMDYSTKVSPGRIRSRIKHVTRETGRVPVVIVDYLQLMQTDQRSSRQSLYEKVTELSRELKILAKDMNAVVIALAQLNRGSEMRTDKKPATSDLRDSGALEQDADTIILIHREDAYEKESPRAGETDLIVAKHRNGPTATLTAAHQFHYSRIRDMSQT